MQIVGILGGMGPAAGADFVRLFIKACTAQMQQQGTPVTDQNFPEHWLAQVPVPDRTAALLNPAPGSHQPLEPMLKALGKLVALRVQSVAIACNTAHAWHGALQAQFPHVKVLHVAQEISAQLSRLGLTKAALLATEGTYHSGLYQAALTQAGIDCINPTEAEIKTLMEGIFEGVKAGNIKLAQRCFVSVAQALTDRYQSIPLIMGCTEIPLGLQGLTAVSDMQLIDPSQVLAQALARQAYS